MWEAHFPTESALSEKQPVASAAVGRIHGHGLNCSHGDQESGLSSLSLSLLLCA